MHKELVSVTLFETSVSNLLYSEKEVTRTLPLPTHVFVSGRLHYFRGVLRLEVFPCEWDGKERTRFVLYLYRTVLRVRAICGVPYKLEDTVSRNTILSNNVLTSEYPSNVTNRRIG